MIEIGMMTIGLYRPADPMLTGGPRLPDHLGPNEAVLSLFIENNVTNKS
jgi:hypothetical protein